MITTESYWRKTGYKFLGTDEELKDKIATCGKQMEFSDEEGYFNSFLCTIDFKECDKCCIMHKKLNPLIEEFVISLNKSLEKK